MVSIEVLQISVTIFNYLIHKRRLKVSLEKGIVIRCEKKDNLAIVASTISVKKLDGSDNNCYGLLNKHNFMSDFLTPSTYRKILVIRPVKCTSGHEKQY